ncbi:LytR family transcriptional regulator [Microlunatus elymi]|uniref:LytR family transcriptional regulator n=1 Tax=Microlunatus elymi TaxID=2596828 RepID=A0A516PUU7_9ACTN|nr:LCP family protein [Microlunatus elymi]QDP94965.1 LytR family transcriptional regulator [Microlunatus elymi]
MPDADQWSWELPKDAESSGRSSQPAGHHDQPDPDHPRPRRAAHAAEGDDFSRTVLLTIAGAAVPGLGLIAARRRVIGWTVLGLFFALFIAVGIWAAVDTQAVLAAAVNPRLLRGVAIGLIVLALIWVAVVVISHLSVARGPMRRSHRIIAAALVGVLSFAVAAPAAVAARYSADQASLVTTVFHDSKDSNSATRPSSAPTSRAQQKNPWADTPRVNILLLGGDAGADRTGTRTDTVMVASIDTKTGDTTLISLPRNTARMPFPDDSPLHKYYPNGFTDGNGDNAEFFLNAMYDNVPQTVPKDILGKTDNLGADALKISVGDALGLKIDYYVLINLDGFRQLIDALGGITVNINTYVAIGGNTDLHIPPKTWLEPGPHQHLNGAKALWFARGRYGADDFQRMDRQRCVVDAIINQANPATVLTRYEAIAQAGKEIVKTDIPQEALPAFVNLSMRVKSGNVRSLVFKHGVNGFSSPDPNFDLMRDQVKQALGETKKPPKKKPSKPTDSASSSEASSDSSSSATPQSESAKDACAWNPEMAAAAQKPAG